MIRMIIEKKYILLILIKISSEIQYKTMKKPGKMIVSRYLIRIFHSLFLYYSVGHNKRDPFRWQSVAPPTEMLGY